MKKNQRGFGLIGILVIIVVLAAAAVAGWLVYDKQKDKNNGSDSTNSSSSSPSSGTASHTDEITNFEQCVAAGNPVMESYPEQCAANGKTFVKGQDSRDRTETRPNAKTYTGKLTCLPKKPNGDGEQTLECAIGLQADDNKYYGLTNNPKYDLPMNTRVTVKGIFTPAGDDEKFDIAGTIDVGEIEKAE